MWETWVRSLGWEDPLEKGMATHSSTLAWKIPWMEEPGRLQSVGSQRVRHDWATSLPDLKSRTWTEVNSMDLVSELTTPRAREFSGKSCSAVWWKLVLLSLCWVCVHTYVRAASLESPHTPWYPMDFSLPGCSIHGILQAKILEWVREALCEWDHF